MNEKGNLFKDHNPQRLRKSWGFRTSEAMQTNEHH